MVHSGTSPLRRTGALAVVLATLMALLIVQGQPASASVTGGCDGSADFASDAAGPYGPNNDTRSNPIVVPKAQNDTVSWTGSVPGTNTNFGGDVEVRIGPTYFIVADWGLPGHDGSNVDDERSDSGEYNMEEFWSSIPGGRNVAQGIYQARAIHNADGVDCVANFFVKFEGNPLESPVVIALLILLVVLLILLVVAGRRREATGKGRMVLAIIVALLLGLVVALLLQQFCVWPLDNLTVIVLPIVMIVIGIMIARSAPFGGAPKPGRPVSDF
jgi:hypothetical protein